MYSPNFPWENFNCHIIPKTYVPVLKELTLAFNKSKFQVLNLHTNQTKKKYILHKGLPLCNILIF